MTDAVSGNQGPATDARNQPVIDPTRNVLDLVAAAIARQDDLRNMQLGYLEKIGNLRAKERMRDHKHIVEVVELRDRHIAEVGHLRAEYADKLREKESERIDAIRAVDVGAVARAAEVSGTQASTLATQQQASADALRAQVEQARIATADALAQALAPITKSVEDLRAAQYAQQGERAGQVPVAEQLAPIISEIRELSRAQAAGVGAKGQQSEGRERSNFAITAALAVAAIAASAAMALFISQKTSPSPSTTVLPSCSIVASGTPCVK